MATHHDRSKPLPLRHPGSLLGQSVEYSSLLGDFLTSKWTKPVDSALGRASCAAGHL